MNVANLVAFHEIPFPDWVARRVVHQCFHPVLAMPLEWASHEAALTQPWWRCPAWTGSPVCQSLCTLLAFLRRNYPGVSEVERRIAAFLRPQYLVAASAGGNVVILETAGGWRLPTQYYGSERGGALPHGILNEATKSPYDRFPVRVIHLVKIYEFHSLAFGIPRSFIRPRTAPHKTTHGTRYGRSQVTANLMCNDIRA